MPTAWDRRTPLEQRRVQNVQLKQTILQAALAFVPAVRSRMAAAGKDARLFKGLEELPTLPLSSRRDVFDLHRNPDGPDGIMLSGSGEGVKRFSDRATLRRIATARLLGGEHDAALAIEGATRPIHMHVVPGPCGRVPVGYTRDDLDLLARAGARLAQVLGIVRGDRLVNLLPAGPTLGYWGIVYLGLGLGATTFHLHREGDPARQLTAASEQRPTVLFVPTEDAVELLEQGVEAGVTLPTLTTLVIVGGSPSVEERERIGEAVRALGAPDAHVASAYGVAEGRVLWGECPTPLGHREGFGFHTYPDLDLVEIIDPESGGSFGDERAGEIVVTSLGFRGGGLPRWRSGDLATGGISRAPCPNCGRTVPRVGPAVQRSAWHGLVRVDGKRRWIDLSLVASAVGERAADWVVEHAVDGPLEGLFVHVGGVADPAPIIELYQDLARVGMPPTQIVAASPAELSARVADAPPPWRRMVRVEHED